MARFGTLSQKFTKIMRFKVLSPLKSCMQASFYEYKNYCLATMALGTTFLGPTFLKKFLQKTFEIVFKTLPLLTNEK